MASTSTTAKKGRKATPENETPAQRFARIGSLRVSNVLDTLDLIGNLSTGYVSTPAQIDAIFAAIQKGVDDNKARFSATKAEQPKRFAL